jgi:glycosyltransferase involved in cell wall biosynthesis
MTSGWSKEISVLVPAYNEETTIVRALRSILDQRFTEPTSIQIIAAPNGCVDRTDEIVDTFFAEQRLPEHVSAERVSLPKASKSRALNAALRHAVGGIVFCLDADCHLAPDALSRMLDVLGASGEVKAVGARNVQSYSEHDTSSYLYEILRALEMWQVECPTATLLGRLLGFERSTVDEFPNVRSDDGWLTLSIAARYGWSAVRRADHAIVYSTPPLNWVDFFEQEGRFIQVTEELLQAFPHLRATLEEGARRACDPHSPELVRRVEERLSALRIPSVRLAELRGSIIPIILEYGRTLASQKRAHVSDWMPILSTKR